MATLRGYFPSDDSGASEEEGAYGAPEFGGPINSDLQPQSGKGGDFLGGGIASGDSSIGGGAGASGAGDIGGTARGGETSRDRGMTGATPSQPSQPTPHQGAVSGSIGGGAEAPNSGGGGGLIPFSPMHGPQAFGGPGLAMGRLFGGSRGQSGGGLGVPLDPQSNFTSDPISELIKKITGGM